MACIAALYAEHFVSNFPGAAYSKRLFWKDELGLAQAIWVLEVENFGPFLVECDAEGQSLFMKANAEVNETFQRLYNGLPLPALKRLGEITSPTQEML